MLIKLFHIGIKIILVLCFASCAKYDDLKVNIDKELSDKYFFRIKVRFENAIHYKTIFENNIQFPVESIYGPHKWELSMNDSLRIYFSTLKLNHNDIHSYQFSIQKRENKIGATLIIRDGNKTFYKHHEFFPSYYDKRSNKNN